jgi:hypothetical protein
VDKKVSRDDLQLLIDCLENHVEGMLEENEACDPDETRSAAYLLAKLRWHYNNYMICDDASELEVGP